MMWDFIVNDKTFRKRFTKCGEYSSNSSGGTLYIHGEEGHFVAYEVRDRTLYIFDSAAPSSPYASRVTEDIVKRKFVMIDCHPQMHKEDSFCQTWSLAWLTPDLRPLVTQVSTKAQSMRTLFTICKRILESECFRFDTRVFNTELKHVGSFSNMTEFLKFSTDMTFQMFSKIFED